MSTGTVTGTPVSGRPHRRHPAAALRGCAAAMVPAGPVMGTVFGLVRPGLLLALL